MEQILINAVAGAIGGGASGAAVKQFDMGTIGNVVAGLLGGGVLGQLFSAIFPFLASAAQSGNFDIGSIVAQAASGGIGGIVLQVIAGFVKNKVMG